MKDKAKIIELLNRVLTGELTSINQYFLHAEMCKNWGYDRLYGAIRKESIEEMKHAEEVMERILFLEGLPNVQRLNKINVGETVPEQFKSDLALEMEAVAMLREGIALATSAMDHNTRHLLEEILEDEEAHIDWIESQLELIKQVGEQNYLAQQIHKKES
ncbi:MAG TPA: bacterioferritin [bacterium]